LEQPCRGYSYKLGGKLPRAKKGKGLYFFNARGKKERITNKERRSKKAGPKGGGAQLFQLCGTLWENTPSLKKSTDKKKERDEPKRIHFHVLHLRQGGINGREKVSTNILR